MRGEQRAGGGGRKEEPQKEPMDIYYRDFPLFYIAAQ